MSASAPVSASPARLRLDRVAWMLLPAAPFALVLAVWAAYWQIARPPAATLPSILAVVQVVGDIASDGRLGDNVLASLWRLLLGASLGIVTGVIAGFATGLYRGISAFLSPLVIFFNAISGIVWLPLMIGWLGIGTALAVFVIWNTVFFIVFQNTVLGVQLVPEVLEQGVRALGAGRLETLRSVTLPGALPYILARADRCRARRRAERARADDLRGRRLPSLRHHHRGLPDHRRDRDRHGSLDPVSDRAAHRAALGHDHRCREGGHVSPNPTMRAATRRRLPRFDREWLKFGLGIVLIALVLGGPHLVGMATASHRLDPALKRARGPSNVIVVLNFTPERFHTERVTSYGVFAGRDGALNRIRLRMVSPENLAELAAIPWVARIEPLK
jgi:ABC-type nitrate/sulfonate/bicarbonate transport system permease component